MSDPNCISYTNYTKAAIKIQNTNYLSKVSKIQNAIMIYFIYFIYFDYLYFKYSMTSKLTDFANFSIQKVIWQVKHYLCCLLIYCLPVGCSPLSQIGHWVPQWFGSTQVSGIRSLTEDVKRYHVAVSKTQYYYGYKCSPVTEKLPCAFLIFLEVPQKSSKGLSRERNSGGHLCQIPEWLTKIA